MTTIYQITDPHVPLQGNDVQAAFLKLMHYVKENPADLLIMTGDLPGIDGSIEVYEWIKRKIPSTQKYFIIPGNHDDAAKLFRVFGSTVCGNSDFLFTEKLDEVDLVFTNTGSTRFPESHLNYLQQESIREGSILFTHFPTKKISDGFMDMTYPLGNVSEADKRIRESNINHVFCGHFHTEFYIEDGYHLHVTPSPAFSIALNETEIVFTKKCIPLRKIKVDGKLTSTEVIYL